MTKREDPTRAVETGCAESGRVAPTASSERRVRKTRSEECIKLVCSRAVATRGRWRDVSATFRRSGCAADPVSSRLSVSRASRWRDAVEAGVSAPVVLAATHPRTLERVPLVLLRDHACG
ncbi:MAG: DUF2237 domain-containing protein [Verrucomicrobia bacterium]|nr:DUF2237 domain-containing protein [Verrucomicrobiota bacterium]